MSNQKKQGGLFSSKKFKHGSVAATLTLVFIAAVILFNAVFSALSSKYGFLWDLTSEQIYGISDQTRKLLADRTKEVSIKFMQPLDQLKSQSSYYPVVTCAEIYAKEFPNVKVEEYDIITNPENMKYFTQRGETVSTTDVIVQCGDEYKIFTLSSFLPTAQSTGRTYAFRGEMYFTSAILSVTAENKHGVSFVTNHGETASTQLMEIFELCGYTVDESLDLLTEEVSDSTQILVINKPLHDFQSSANGVSEIEKLNEYLNSNRSVMLFLDPGEVLPNLEELMLEWGISVSRGNVVQDDKKSLPKADTYVICDYPDYSADSESSAAVIVGGSVANSQVVSPGSLPLVIEKAENVKDPYVTVESVLRSSVSSYVQGDNQTLAGPFDVMALATRTQYINHGNSINEEVKGHLLVSAAPDFLSLCYDSAPYANRALIFNAIKLMSDEDLVTDIGLKLVDDTSLEISAEDVTRYTVIMAAVLPGIIVIAGVAVWIKRKHL